MSILGIGRMVGTLNGEMGKMSLWISTNTSPLLAIIVASWTARRDNDNNVPVKGFMSIMTWLTMVHLLFVGVGCLMAIMAIENIKTAHNVVTLACCSTLPILCYQVVYVAIRDEKENENG
ncbi:MAG: hypothetical protein AAGM67_18905, partial [Bacteroidota bacterium]